jgi:hypothetical protein
LAIGRLIVDIFPDKATCAQGLSDASCRAEGVLEGFVGGVGKLRCVNYKIAIR